MAFDLDELPEHDGTGDCPICRAQAVVEKGDLAVC
jgi:hypothetical protein